MIQLTAEEEKLSERYKVFIGREFKSSKHRVKAKTMVKFAKLLGSNDPKYIGVELEDGTLETSNIVAHNCYPAFFSVGDAGVAFEFLDWRFPPKEGEEKGEKMVKHAGLLVHGAQEYDYSKAEIPIQPGQKLTVTAVMENVYIKSEKLWLVVRVLAHTKEGKLVVESVVTSVIRKGGW